MKVDESEIAKLRTVAAWKRLSDRKFRVSVQLAKESQDWTKAVMPPYGNVLNLRQERTKDGSGMELAWRSVCPTALVVSLGDANARLGWNVWISNKEAIEVARKLIVLCENDLKKIMQPEKVSVPEADPKPILAGHVLGTYATLEIAERAVMNFNCEAKHWIVEAMHFRRLEI